MNKTDQKIQHNTSFKSNVLRLVSGTVIAQVIGLAAAPILTRIYSPEAFGVSALFASITAILGVFACMQYELSIILANNDREAANQLAVSLVFTVLMTTFMIPLVYWGSTLVVQYLKIPKLAPYLWLVPLALFIYGIFTSLNYWNTRTKHYSRLSIARVTSQLAGTGSSLGVGFAGHANGGTLIVTSVFGQAVATIVLFLQIWRDHGRFILSSITLYEMLEGIKRYRKFPLYSSWGTLVNTASWQIPVIMLSMFFSSAVMGFYSIGFRLIQIPMNLIGGAIGQVLFQYGVEQKKNGKLGNTVEILYEKMLIFGLLPSLILMVIGPDIFSVILGKYWSEAGVYAQTLAPWALVWFISSPLSTVYFILEKQKEEMLIHVAIFISRLVSLFIGGLCGSPRIAIAIFSLSGVVVYGYLLYKIFVYTGLNTFIQLNKFYKNLGVAVLYILPIILVKYLNLFTEIGILILVLFISAIYYYQHRYVIQKSV